MDAVDRRGPTTGSIVGSVWGACRTRGRDHLRMLWLAAMPMILASALQDIVSGWPKPEEADGAAMRFAVWMALLAPVATIIAFLIGQLAQARFQTLLFRLELLGERSPWRDGLRLGPRDWRLFRLQLGFAAALALAVAVAALAFGLAHWGAVAVLGSKAFWPEVVLGTLAAGGAVTLIAIIAARYSLIAPACTLDDPTPFATSWRMTRGHALPILGAAVVTGALALGLIALTATASGIATHLFGSGGRSHGHGVIAGMIKTGSHWFGVVGSGLTLVILVGVWGMMMSEVWRVLAPRSAPSDAQVPVEETPP